jgi:hypothetical protein
MDCLQQQILTVAFLRQSNTDLNIYVQIIYYSCIEWQIRTVMGFTINDKNGFNSISAERMLVNITSISLC